MRASHPRIRRNMLQRNCRTRSAQQGMLLWTLLYHVTPFSTRGRVPKFWYTKSDSVFEYGGELLHGMTFCGAHQAAAVLVYAFTCCVHDVCMSLYIYITLYIHVHLSYGSYHKYLYSALNDAHLAELFVRCLHTDIGFGSEFKRLEQHCLHGKHGQKG
jgi:hypothetical protein